MDSIGSSLYSSPSWVGGAQGVLPSQPSQRIVIPTNATGETNQTNNSNQTTRPGGSESANVNNQGAADPSRRSNQTDNATDTSQEQRQQEQAVQQVLSQLRARDQEVRTHEQAHLSAAGQYATGGIKYNYQTGPDGQRYAIGGSVGIDTSPVAGDPEATLQKARVVQRAALAPAEPSGQDMKVAAQASQMMMQAQVEIQAQQTQESQKDDGEVEDGLNSPDSASDNADNLPNIQSREAASSSEPRTADQSERIEMNPDRNEFEIRMSMQGEPTDLFAISA